MSEIVVIVGRPNVGKSTLFNRLIENRDAIMDNESGVTRDRHYGKSQWNGKHFTVIDTGGYVTGSEDVFEGAIREQVEIALEEASVVIFMVDCFSGLTGLDKDFANVLRRSKKPVYLAANKADNTERAHMIGDFYALGMGEVFAISAANGSGTGELLDVVTEKFEIQEEKEGSEIPKIAIVGRPNVGKSSMINMLLGKERSIVTDIAGTTRDSIDAHYKAYGKNFILTDTAGIRKKSKVKENIEFYSVLRSVKAIETSDVCIVVLDAENGLESQDINIIHLANKNKKGIVIMVNKWDLVKNKESNTAKEYEAKIKEKLGTLNYIPVIFTSVLEKQRLFKVLDKAIEVYENKMQKIATSTLNELLLKEIERTPPPAYRGKYIRIKYITQLPTFAPTFAFFSNFPNHIKEPYARFLENKIRKHFNFEGVPLKLFFRQK